MFIAYGQIVAKRIKTILVTFRMKIRIKSRLINKKLLNKVNFWNTSTFERKLNLKSCHLPIKTGQPSIPF